MGLKGLGQTFCDISGGMNIKERKNISRAVISKPRSDEAFPRFSTRLVQYLVDLFLSVFLTGIPFKPQVQVKK